RADDGSTAFPSVVVWIGDGGEGSARSGLVAVLFADPSPPPLARNQTITSPARPSARAAPACAFSAVLESLDKVSLTGPPLRPRTEACAQQASDQVTPERAVPNSHLEAPRPDGRSNELPRRRLSVSE